MESGISFPLWRLAHIVTAAISWDILWPYHMDMLKSSMKTKYTDKAASMYVALECLHISISIPIYMVSFTILLMLLKHYSRKGSISFRTRDSVSVGSHSPHSWSPESKQTAAPRTGFAMCSPHQEFPTGPQFSPSSFRLQSASTVTICFSRKLLCANSGGGTRRPSKCGVDPKTALETCALGCLWLLPSSGSARAQDMFRVKCIHF